MILFIKYNKNLFQKLTRKEFKNGLLAVTIIIALIVLLRYSGVAKYFNVGEIQSLKDTIENYGALGYCIYILVNILTGFIGFPVVIIKFLGGLIFNPIWGTILISIGSTMGAGLSFLSSRYIGKNFAKKMVSKRENFKKIYDGVEKYNWRMIMVTRLIPIFPYSFQNYVYGITEIKFTTYIFSTFIFMLPSNFGIVYLAYSAINEKSIIFALFVYILSVVVFGFVGLMFSLNESKNEVEEEKQEEMENLDESLSH